MPGQQPYDRNQPRDDGRYDAYPSQDGIPPHERRPRSVEVGQYNPLESDNDRVPPLSPIGESETPPGTAKSVVWPTREAAKQYGPIQNARPSKRYPNLDTLSNTPLSELIRSSLVVEPKSSVLRAIGKLQIRTSNHPRHLPASGSAWLVSPSVIATSAHNLYDSTRRAWSASVEFCPAYDYYSNEPLVTSLVTSCYLPRDYLDNPTTDRDIGLCFLDRNVGDIVDAVIPMKPIQDHSFFDRYPVQVVGYPAGSHFDFGKQMWHSEGHYLMGQSNGPDATYCPVLASDFGGGASGCPWLTKIDGNYVAVGITSGHAKLHYDDAELNLMSLTSPLFTQQLFDELSDNHVFHEFAL
jgi:V8-like Glu-specific endopeptidase